jgi:hypothetical protein
LLVVTPIIEKKDTCMKQVVSPYERLTATLRLLATGRSYEGLKFSILIFSRALGRIIPGTCYAIYKVLKKEFVKVRKVIWKYFY